MNVIIKIEGNSSRSLELSLAPAESCIFSYILNSPRPRPRHFTPRLLFLIDFPDTRGESSGVNVIFYAFFSVRGDGRRRCHYAMPC